MLDLASTLVSDFQESLSEPSFCSDYSSIIRTGNLARIRSEIPAVDESDDIPHFKAKYQLASLLKRYRFRKDIYTTDELTQQAIESFAETQRRIACLNLDAVSSDTKWILDYAAMFIRETLGGYSDEEHRELCRFGRKASVGVPLRSACEAARWELPISGSRKQISWFDAEMRDIACVQDYWTKQIESGPYNGPIYQETSFLTLVLVPKTFKSLRSIMPNTTIGSYMSYGLGEMIRKRLKRIGYDISKLQMKHRDIAKLASLHRQYVTADLSSASDSISVALVNRLFPSDWLEILHQSRIGTVVLPDGNRVESETFCTMGIGYTFPLQTLVFLSLLVAIQARLLPRSRWSRISVYGDDLIYSKLIHPSVRSVFSQLGFVINEDKTYDDSGFRESCGGDYFHGVDVRPFQPRNGSADVNRKVYEAVLYKYINGLLMRWSEHEIASSLALLTSEVARVAGCCKLVPGDFPDESGIKCPALGCWDFLSTARVAHPKHVGHGVFRFAYLRVNPDLRKEDRHEPYLWAALRSGDRITDYSSQTPHLELPRHQVVERIEALTGAGEDKEPLLIWKEEEQIKPTKSRLTGRRLRRVRAFTVVSGTGTYRRQYGTSCFGVRR
jgi:hypothetical protein